VLPNFNRYTYRIETSRSLGADGGDFLKIDLKEIGVNMRIWIDSVQDRGFGIPL
jgi:hypothetical protein